LITITKINNVKRKKFHLHSEYDVQVLLYRVDACVGQSEKLEFRLVVFPEVVQDFRRKPPEGVLQVDGVVPDDQAGVPGGGDEISPKKYRIVQDLKMKKK
jgi:hypothetical protein